MSDCVFDQNSMKCIEHGGAYMGVRICPRKERADKLEAKIAWIYARKIAKLQAERDAMRSA